MNQLLPSGARNFGSFFSATAFGTEKLVSLFTRARVLLLILSVELAALRPATAQSPTPTRPPQLRSVADAGAIALMKKVAAAHRNVKGLRFSVQNTWRSEKGAAMSNQIHVLFKRPDQVRLNLDSRGTSAPKQLELLLKGATLFSITTYEAVASDGQNVSGSKNNVIEYSKAEGGHVEDRFFYLSYISRCAALPTVLSLLKGKNEILAPRIIPGNSIRQQVKRLPSQIIDGQKMDGVQVRRSFGSGRKPHFGSAITISYWFDATNHLLSRCQFYIPAMMSPGGIEIETGQRTAPQLKPASVTTHTFVKVEVDPAFTPNDFRFVPPPGAIRVDEYGQRLRSSPTSR